MPYGIPPLIRAPHEGSYPTENTRLYVGRQLGWGCLLTLPPTCALSPDGCVWAIVWVFHQHGLLITGGRKLCIDGSDVLIHGGPAPLGIAYILARGLGELVDRLRSICRTEWYHSVEV
jgi:hypothetical protein